MEITKKEKKKDDDDDWKGGTVYDNTGGSSYVGQSEDERNPLSHAQHQHRTKPGRYHLPGDPQLPSFRLGHVYLPAG